MIYYTFGSENESRNLHQEDNLHSIVHFDMTLDKESGDGQLEYVC